MKCWGAVVAMMTCVFGCGSDGGEGPPGRPCDEWREPPSVPEQPSWDLHAAEREPGTAPGKCVFGTGSTVAESVGPEAPALITPQLKHVIVLLRENRSFDNMLGAYTGEQLGRSNWDPTGFREGGVLKSVPTFHESHYCTANPAHDWSSVHLSYNNGLLDGFVAASNRGATNNGGGCVAMGYYDRSDLPLYYWLADNFAISANYHASMLGETMPNITYYYYASSCGATDNAQAIAKGGCPKEMTSIFELLAQKGATSAVYSDSPLKSLGAAPRLSEVQAVNIRSIARFEADLMSSDPAALPDVAFVEPNYGHLPGDSSPQNDEHPPANLLDGQKFVQRIVGALMASPRWQNSVLFITWDEHGGYYDHVVPPMACEPDDMRPADFAFDRLGFRTPFFAISPFAIKGHVSHYTSDHSSILRFIEAWKGLGALNKRDGNAWPLLDMFDFTSARTDIDLAGVNLTLPSPPAEQLMSCSDPDNAASCCEKSPPCKEEP